MRTHQIGAAAEDWVQGELTRRRYAVTPFPRNYPVVDLLVQGETEFRVQVKCSDVQHIKFGGRRSTTGLLETDFVIALMPSSEKRDLVIDGLDVWTFIIPGPIVKKAAEHVHNSYIENYRQRKGVSPSEAFGPTIKFYRNVSWHNRAREWLWPYKDNWAALPASG